MSTPGAPRELLTTPAAAILQRRMPMRLEFSHTSYFRLELCLSPIQKATCWSLSRPRKAGPVGRALVARQAETVKTSEVL
jgi:hypothetical protein